MKPKKTRKPAKPKPPATKRPGYEAFKVQQAAIARERSASGREIGEPNPVKDPARREACRLDFRRFCETYHPETFRLAWSPDHLRAIARIETVVIRGETFAIGMPRGMGKSALCNTAAEWALLYEHRLFVAMIGPEEDHAKNQIETIVRDLENNPLYQEDFDDVCLPLRRLEGIPQRRLLYRGAPVYMRLAADRIILPRLDPRTGRVLMGGVVMATSLTGQIRGMTFKADTGQVLRPQLAIIDDPQKDQMALSPSQVDKLERIVRGSVMGLAGPGAALAAICPCTVIAKDDLADRLLDRQKNPSWQGERTKLVYAFPQNEALWREYRDLRDGLMRDRNAGVAAASAASNEFYAARREAMDAGAVVAWPERVGPGELSAIQHAMNLLYDRGERAFFAEYQNEPIPETPVDSELLSTDAIAARVNGMKQGHLPIDAVKLTAFVDVQDSLLYYVVAAWAADFTGAVVDYGTFPDQQSPYFALKDARRTLASEYAGGGQESRWFKGLTKLMDWMLGAEWYHEDGTPKRVDRVLIDANYGRSTETIYRFCRQSPFASLLLPSHGKYIGASTTPFIEYRRRPGERLGLNWRVGISPSKRQRHVTYDTNFWKSFVHERLKVEYPDPSSLTLYGKVESKGKRARAVDHRMIAEQLTAEYRVRTSGRGREVDEWKLRADGLDNHLLDCCVGAAVAASIEGAKLPGETGRRIPKPRAAKW